jgi:hypothetical protein
VRAHEYRDILRKEGHNEIGYYQETDPTRSGKVTEEELTFGGRSFDTGMAAQCRVSKQNFTHRI